MALERTPERWAWQNMKYRCNKPNNNRYKYYGGRGITYDPRWEDYDVFLADMGRKPPSPPRYTLDRINNNGNYNKANCRWATYIQQNNNKPWKRNYKQWYQQWLQKHLKP